MEINVSRSISTEPSEKDVVLAFFLWLQATQIFPHFIFGCKDKGFR